MNKMIFNLYPLILTLIMMKSLMMISLNYSFHPINMMLTLILLTFFIILKMNFLFISLAPFILFLIMIGGLLVIFLYITSLSNNEIFTFNFNNIINILYKMTLIIIMLLIIMKYLHNYFLMKFYLNYYFFEMFSIFYNKNIIFIMNYLFYTMMCIMYMCYKFKVPLRQLKF